MKRVFTTWLFDLCIAFCYAVSLFEAIVYDAKTRTGGIGWYVVVYLLFALLVRSYVGIVIMCVFAWYTTIYLAFTNPIVQAAEGYFTISAYLFGVATIFATIVQFGVLLARRTFFTTYENSKRATILATAIAVVFTIGFTIYVSLVPTR